MASSPAKKTTRNIHYEGQLLDEVHFFREEACSYPVDSLAHRGFMELADEALEALRRFRQEGPSSVTSPEAT